MPRLTWGAIGERFYEAGVDRGVLYLADQSGVPWNGLTAVTETPTGGEAKGYYIDGVKYLNLPADEEFEATIEAFTYPELFNQCQGIVSAFSGLLLTAQKRKSFGLSWRTKIGNDLSEDAAYKIHLVYGALAEPSSHGNNTIDDSTSPGSFSWKISTLPPAITGYKRTAHIMVDSRSTDPLALAALEDNLYGSNSLTSHLPSPAELFEIFTVNSSFIVVDNGDGTWTATGTDDQIVVDGTTFVIDTPSATILDSESYRLSSP